MRATSSIPDRRLKKAPTGIAGFDAITAGGLPRGRPTLVVGNAGAGKTIFALQTLVNAATDWGEPGIFVAFEENAKQIVENAGTFGWDLAALEKDKLFFIDAKLPATVVKAGEFDLVGIMGALTAKAKEMSCTRVVFDGIDVLLTLLNDPVVERREVYRLHEWLLDSCVTGIITAKSDATDRQSTERYAFMQFVVDCVVHLDHRVADRVSLRSLRVAKYRGSAFAENEFPLVISPTGIKVATFGAVQLDHPVSTERVSTGVDRLDTMLGGGYYRASSVLITGAPGTAKTTLAGAFTAASCLRGERVLYVSFDESADQIVRNLRSVGIELQSHRDSEQLRIYSTRTETASAEAHFVTLQGLIDEFQPQALIVDPISALMKTGGSTAATHASLRLLDFAKSKAITTVCTSLLSGSDDLTESTETQISTIADTWMHVSYVVHGGERNRALTVIKSRGTKHSNQVRELVLTDHGVTLADVYTAGGEVLMGTARWEREAQVRAEKRRRRAAAERTRKERKASEAEITARISALEAERESHRAALAVAESEEAALEEQASETERGIQTLRAADLEPNDPVGPPRKRAAVGARGGGSV